MRRRPRRLPSHRRRRSSRIGLENVCGRAGDDVRFSGLEIARLEVVLGIAFDEPDRGRGIRSPRVTVHWVLAARDRTKGADSMCGVNLAVSRQRVEAVADPTPVCGG
ncbi:hypothetical protein D8S78_09505 [Natrialba swarupiae]|nr:hypothetical protein [Natrialba swarupiae]